jgi:preprotein translocase subunit SecF
MRTLNTSITALLPIVSLLVLGSFVLGATTLEEFALALFIGLASGAYSSIFIASPTLALLKEREERWKNVRTRLESRAGSPTRDRVPAAPVVEEDDAEESGSRTTSRTITPRNIPIGGTIQPRGRKKSSRRR